MTLTERLSEYVRACFTGIWIQSLRARRRDRRDRAALPPAGLVAGHLGHRPRPVARRPATTRRATAVGAAGPAGRDQGARPRWPRPRARRSWCSATSTGSWAASRSIQALDTASRRRQAGPDVRRHPVAGRADPRRAGEAQFVVIEHDLPGRDQLAADRPARSPPSRASCPRARPWPPSSTSAAGLTRVEAENAFSPLAGPPRPARPGRALGAQGPDAQEVRPADDPPRRRDLRRPGRPGGPQGVLPALADRQAVGPRAPAPGRAPARACRAPARARSARRWATRSAGRR